MFIEKGIHPYQENQWFNRLDCFSLFSIQVPIILIFSTKLLMSPSIEKKKINLNRCLVPLRVVVCEIQWIKKNKNESISSIDLAEDIIFLLEWVFFFFYWTVHVWVSINCKEKQWEHKFYWFSRRYYSSARMGFLFFYWTVHVWVSIN